jgi:hypothetical protein
MIRERDLVMEFRESSKSKKQLEEERGDYDSGCVNMSSHSVQTLIMNARVFCWTHLQGELNSKQTAR